MSIPFFHSNYDNYSNRPQISFLNSNNTLRQQKQSAVAAVAEVKAKLVKASVSTRNSIPICNTNKTIPLIEGKIIKQQIPLIKSKPSIYTHGETIITIDRRINTEKNINELLHNLPFRKINKMHL